MKKLKFSDFAEFGKGIERKTWAPKVGDIVYADWDDGSVRFICTLMEYSSAENVWWVNSRMDSVHEFEGWVPGEFIYYKKPRQRPRPFPPQPLSILR